MAQERNNRTIQELCNMVDELEMVIHVLTKILQPNIGRHLLEAVRSKDEKTVKILVKYENDTCTTDDEYGDTPLMVAAAAAAPDNLDMVRLLLECGANTERGDKTQTTALHKAAWNGDVEMCRVLLDGQANVNSMNRGRFTPLHRAAEGNKLSVVKLLVERGANLELKNGAGLTAEDLAREMKYTEVEVYLKSNAK